MSYFSESYPLFRYPVQTGAEAGFRSAQLGAIHSAAAHFSNRNEPGIITMPTGSGKTAVLISAAYVLRANRVLIITPSRLVREQMAEAVANLNDLTEIGALPGDHAKPRVKSTVNRVTSNDDWEEMRNYDVVVATVQSISPGFEGIPTPPNDLFDLVLVDEAHHSPARTWQVILDHFAPAKRLLFTATPFRQDQKEIKGRFIFTYDLRNAFRDGIFGQITYQAVTPGGGESHDEAIARAAEAQLRVDTERGFNHRVMVRTDGLPRARELFDLYQQRTGLRLSIISGSSSLRSVKRTIERLRSGELDGIICVNMLGEGFNFPSLKIAAIHAPHKSLSVTLQFVGRFARTAGVNLGPATFLAVPSDIEIETERLYDSRAIWQDIIQNLAALRVGQEAEIREVLQSFTSTIAAPDLSDISLYVLEPYYHVKVYQLESDIDVQDEMEFPKHLQVAFRGASPEHNAAVYITREISLPRWSTDDRLSHVRTDLFIFYYDPTTKLLFICASRRGGGLYDELMESIEHAEPRPLPLVRLNKALNDLTATEFFNVGMRNRVLSNTNESYRIITGPNADKSVLKSDARLYHRGHAFGRATEGGVGITIGLSSASKIWSNKSSKLPALILWCSNLARKISSDRIPVTHSGLDYLDPGEELTELPNNIVAVNWPSSVYRSPVSVKFMTAGTQMRVPITDGNLAIDRAASTADAVMIAFTYGVMEYRFTFSFGTNRFFEPATANEPELQIEHDRASVPFLNYVNDQMLMFYTSDLSLIDGYNIFRPPAEPPQPLNLEAMEIVDWVAGSVNIECEFGNAGTGRQSVQDFIETRLTTSDANVVYCDHGTGEIADFVSFKQSDGRVLVQFFHCKKSPSANPGSRLDSVTDLTGQIVKSVTWGIKQRILDTIRRRFTQNIGTHRFARGDLNALVALLDTISAATMDFEFVAVQPGLQKEGVSEEVLHVLAGASDYLVRGGFKPLKVLCS
jgi:superfamily II DNA or RNA helicase